VGSNPASPTMKYWDLANCSNPIQSSYADS